MKPTHFCSLEELAGRVVCIDRWRKANAKICRAHTVHGGGRAASKLFADSLSPLRSPGMPESMERLLSVFRMWTEGQCGRHCWRRHLSEKFLKLHVIVNFQPNQLPWVGIKIAQVCLGLVGVISEYKCSKLSSSRDQEKTWGQKPGLFLWLEYNKHTFPWGEQVCIFMLNSQEYKCTQGTKILKGSFKANGTSFDTVM